MPDRLQLTSALFAFLLAYIVAVSAAESMGTVALYPESGFNPSTSAQANRVEQGTCTQVTSPIDASSAINYASFPVLLYPTSDCSGTPVTILQPYRQAKDRAPAHVPVNSVRGRD